MNEDQIQVVLATLTVEEKIMLLSMLKALE